MNNKVEKCKFYNDHDCNVPECDELLDEIFLPVSTCDERKDCTYKKYSSCIFFQNGDCGMCRVEDGEEYYFDGLAKCNNNPNCYYKQILAEQAKNKKLVEALELNDKTISFITRIYLMKYRIEDIPFVGLSFANKDLENRVNEVVELVKSKAQQALNEVNKC